MNTRLTDIVVPDTVTYVGSAAFNCNTLKSATTHIAAGVINTGVDNLHITERTEFSYQELSSFKSLTELTIPFAGCKKNGTVSTYFGYIFEHRYSKSEDKWIPVPVVPTTLKKVTLTNALRIDNECFSECSYIEEIILNEGVKSIGEKAFNRCFALTTVTIPKSVNNIAADAFAQCDSLTTIRCYRNTKGEEIAKQLGVTIEYLDAICQTHSFGAWNIITDSTCTTEGLQTRTCTVCGTAESQVIPLKPHSFGEWTIVDQPQCNLQGTHSHTCFVCQYIELETMDATGHSFVFDCVIYDSTETSTGLLQEKCVFCGETVQKEIPLKTPQQPNVSTDSSNSENSNLDPENSNNDSENSNSNIASADSVSTLDENESGGNPVLFVLIGVVALLLVGAGVAVVIIKKKSKSDSANANESSTVEADEAQQPKSE